MAIPTRAELDCLIRDRLAADPGFRDALLADPRAAVSELVGIPIPNGVIIEVHEESLSHVHLVITAQTSAGEISDNDLERVAGGGGTTCWFNFDERGP